MTRLARVLGCDGYAALHRVSIEEPERFWRAVAADLELDLARPWDRVLDDSRGIEWTTWFEGARLNIAQACVHAWAERTPDAVAAVFRSEDGLRDEWTFAALSRAGREARRGARRARRRRGRPRRDLHADGARGRRRLARLRAHRRGPGADLLRLRRAGGRPAPAGLRREGRDHGRLLAPPRDARADARDDRGGAARGADRRARRRVVALRPDLERRARPRRAAAARGRGGAPLPARVHLRDDRAARRARCTCTAASCSRSPARRPTSPTSAPATASSSRRTWAGSWGRGRWSAPARSGPRVVYMEGAPDRPDDRLWTADRGGARDDARRLARPSSAR